MNITRDNFPEIMVDYLDGNLDAIAIAELMVFVEQHPDLKAELEEISGMKGSLDYSEGIHYEGKSALKKYVDDTKVNQLLIAELHDELENDDRKLLRLLDDDIRVQRWKPLFKSTILNPEKGIFYPYKSRLKKHDNLKVLWYVASAAAVLLLFVMMRYDGSDHGSQVALKNGVQSPVSIFMIRGYDGFKKAPIENGLQFPVVEHPVDSVYDMTMQIANASVPVVEVRDSVIENIDEPVLIETKEPIVADAGINERKIIRSVVSQPEELTINQLIASKVGAEQGDTSYKALALSLIEKFSRRKVKFRKDEHGEVREIAFQSKSVEISLPR